MRAVLDLYSSATRFDRCGENFVRSRFAHAVRRHDHIHDRVDRTNFVKCHFLNRYPMSVSLSLGDRLLTRRPQRLRSDVPGGPGVAVTPGVD